MEIKAGRILKTVYCLVLLGSFFIAWHMAASSWIGLATGLAFRGGILLRIAIFLIIALRIISVIFNPKALDVYAPGFILKAVRVLGIFLMLTGLTVITAMFFIKPLTLALLGSAGDGGIGYFAVGLYLVFISPAGIIGVLVFEIARLGGSFIKKRESGSSAPEATEKRKMPLPEKLCMALVILTALILALNSQKYRIAGNVFFSESTGRIKTLVKLGCDANKKTVNGYSLLHHASSRGDRELVELLISKGADVNAGDKWGATPLHCISQDFFNKTEEERYSKGDKGILQGLECKFGTKDEEAKLRIAEVLISRGANVNANTQSGTPLHTAAFFNKLKIAKLLIEHGANVNAIDSSFDTPLHRTGMRGDYADMARLLVENGANVNATGKFDYSPLHIASEYGNREVVEYLLSQKANVNAASKHGLTPLHFAAGLPSRHELENKEVVEILLANGAVINAGDESGFTALHNAAAHGSPGTVEALLAHHADVNARALGGDTPLHNAVRSRENNFKNIELLIRNGALINFKNQRGETALDVANYYGYKEKASLLTSNGAK